MAATASEVATRDQLLRRALGLLGFTVLYNIAEGVIAVWFGGKAGSTSLVAFGIDSGIECAASGVLLWRMAVQMRGADAERTEAAERRARRFIGVPFFALAVYVLVEAGLTLWDRDAPDASPVGIVLTILSLIVMPLLAWLKLRTARGIGSRALAAEAKETVACSWLSAITLAGLGFNAAIGWWWADPVAALTMIPWLLREGREAWSGEDECGD
jgi:divalent metal cation (Fe/Co/Zn/Cd) transporter